MNRKPFLLLSLCLLLTACPQNRGSSSLTAPSSTEQGYQVPANLGTTTSNTYSSSAYSSSLEAQREELKRIDNEAFQASLEAQREQGKSWARTFCNAYRDDSTC
jgi:hypothetical protein